MIFFVFVLMVSSYVVIASPEVSARVVVMQRLGLQAYIRWGFP